jgi:hypothetical protein
MKKSCLKFLIKKFWYVSDSYSFILIHNGLLIISLKADNDINYSYQL